MALQILVTVGQFVGQRLSSIIDVFSKGVNWPFKISSTDQKWFSKVLQKGLTSQEWAFRCAKIGQTTLVVVEKLEQITVFLAFQEIYVTITQFPSFANLITP